MECPEYKNCTQRRVEEAEQRGIMTQKLINIESIVTELRADQKVMNSKVNKLYVKVAGISAGIAVVGFALSHFVKL